MDRDFGQRESRREVGIFSFLDCPAIYKEVININKLLTQATTVVPEAGNTVATQADTGINWWWLLPLLAIPLILYAVRDRKQTTHTSTMSGAKGGRTEDEEDI